MAMCGRAIVAHAPTCAAIAAKECLKEAPALVGSPSMGFPGIFELVEAATEAAATEAAATEAAAEAEVSTLQTSIKEQRKDCMASKDSLLLDGTEEAVIEAEQNVERPDVVKPTELWNARVRLQDEHVKLQARHTSVMHLVGSQQRLIEDLESDIEALRSALKSQSMLLAEELSRAMAAASNSAKEAPVTPSKAPLRHQRRVQQQEDDEGASTEEEPDTDGSAMESVGAAEFYDSDTGSASGAAKQLGRQNTGVVCASDFVASICATQQQEAEEEDCRSAFAAAAYALPPAPHATHLALLDNPLLPLDASLPATAAMEEQAPRGPLPLQDRQSALAAGSGSPLTSGRCTPTTTTPLAQPPKRQLSARDVVAFGSMGFSWGIAPPEDEVEQPAYGVDGPAAGVEAARQMQGQHQEKDAAQEFDEHAGVVADEYAVEVAATGMRVWRADLHDETVADAVEAVSSDGMRRSPSSANHGDVLAASLASYRSCKEGSLELRPACHSREGSWEVPVVVQEQQQSDPLHGTMLGTLYRMFSS